MTISVACSACDTRLRAADTAAGKKIRCPKCKERIKVPAPDEEEAEPEEEPRVPKANPIAKSRRQEAEDDEEDEPRPRKKKKKKSSSQPSKLPLILGVSGGTLLLVAVIVGVAIWLLRGTNKTTSQASNPTAKRLS